MIYITGDIRGIFHRIGEFCRENHTTKKDILIILGDVGVNYSDRSQSRLIRSGNGTAISSTAMAGGAGLEDRCGDIPYGALKYKPTEVV